MRRILTVAALTLMGLVVAVGPAWAHLDLVRTTPADGATRKTEVKQVRLFFTVPGQPAGSGIVLLDRTGRQIPAQLSSPDSGATWIVTPESKLGTGAYGVRWRVAAPDTHPKTGSFRFTVDVPADKGALTAAPDASVDSSGLDDLLAQAPDTTAAESLRWIGTTAMMAGVLLSLGGLAFLGLVMVGRRDEVATVLTAVRWAAALVLAGSAVQIVARSAMRQDGDWSSGIAPSALADLLGSGTYGVAVGLRVIGALLILLGVGLAVVPAPQAAWGMIAGGGESEPPPVAASLSRSRLALLGAGLCLASFLFDGHTETASPRALVWLSDLIHVGAAAVWVGGIAMLAAVLWRRRRVGRRLDAAYIAVRFSVIAGASLALTGIAGVALSFWILEEPGQLWSSTWGRVLLAKVALVCVVAGIGAYNHLRIIPALERAAAERRQQSVSVQNPPPDPQESPHRRGAAGTTTMRRTQADQMDDQMSGVLWWTACAEMLILLAVTGLTAWLVNASAIG